MTWPVMELCDAQLLDVNPNDILCNGLYRKCNTYKGGGGYDKFPTIYQKRFGQKDDLNDQFVVQLRGCPLACPYCYVTPTGVWSGNCHQVSTQDMVNAFYNSKCKVFHLMGGAPALYIYNWIDIIENIGDNVFHSDIMLVEGEYKKETIERLAKFPNTLHAVSIKGGTPEEFYKNTRTKLDEALLYKNLDLMVTSNLPFYFTFTGMEEHTINIFKETILKRYNDASLLDDSFAITLIHYNALDY